MSDRKPREFWINQYAPPTTHKVWDCVAHTTLERATNGIGAAAIAKCIHVIEYSAYTDALKAIKEAEKICGEG